jgi:hypothetical protein
MKNNKGSVHGVARAAGAFRPTKRGMQRFGVLVLGICALLGVTQASNIRQLFSAMAGGVSELKPVPVSKSEPTGWENIDDITEGTLDPTAEQTASTPNIVDLIGDSEYIIRGLVKEVTDGFENGVPYTQVTLQVNEAIRGNVGEEYTFRQFGLVKPRKLENGKTYLGTTPEGWSRYSVGEDTMLFLYQSASITKLRTTTGLGQGKVIFAAGNAVSQVGNDGLFENVEVDTKLLNDKDKRLLATKRGAVNAEGFMSFVRRAVKDKWIEGGKLKHVKK